MRRYINIVGVGQRRKGVSEKSNRPYDFTPIAFTYEHESMSGLAAGQTLLSADCCPPGYNPSVGETVEVFMRMDYKSRQIVIDGVL